MFQIVDFLQVFQFLQSSDGRLYSYSRSGGVGTGTTSYCFHTGSTVPDTHSLSFHLGFAIEGVGVLGMPANFNFLHYFPQGKAITGPLFNNDFDLLGAFSHVAVNQVGKQKAIY